jgi:hypothetical protein
MLKEKEQKVAKTFECEPCDFVSCKKTNYEKHLTPSKHKSLISLTGKEVKSREGLWLLMLPHGLII